LSRLDLYMPPYCGDDTPKPVVIFVTGGAWIIGYKGWGSLLGQQLSDHDIIVICLDYRCSSFNFHKRGPSCLQKRDWKSFSCCVELFKSGSVGSVECENAGIFPRALLVTW
jgi:carboxylesterase type B